MKREERLKKNYEFKQVYATGKSRAAKYTIIYYCINNRGICRLGVVISKKVGKSVVRHRLKRLYKEAFSRLKLQEKMEKGYDIIIVARKGAAALKFAQVLEEMTELLKKGNILR
ncbi:MAG TPA: ribonuclease P protein component [Firmicutes bacterium]|nr:ribonuclease P protein component [Bacillota bacterium]